MKRFFAVMLSLLVLGLAGCGMSAKVQSNSSEPLTSNVIVYQADTTITSEMMNPVMDALNARFKDLGFTSVSVERNGDKQLKVEVKPSNPDIHEIAEITGQPGKVKLVGPDNEVIITEKDIKSAKPSKDETYKTFDIYLTADGTKKLADATQRLIGKRVAFYLDDKQLTNAIVSVPLTQGGIQVPGSSTVEEAKILAAVLNSGKTLPFLL